MLCANLDSLRLQHLAHVEEARKILRLGIILEQIVVDDRVAFVVLLMREHHRRKDAGAIFRLRECLDGLHLGKRLEAIFSDKARVMRLVGRERHPSVPHIPDMRVAALVVVAESFVVGAGRAGPVRRLGIEPRDYAVAGCR